MGLFSGFTRVREEAFMNELIQSIRSEGIVRVGPLQVPCDNAVEVHSGIWVGPQKGAPGDYLAVFSCRGALWSEVCGHELIVEMLDDPNAGAMTLTMRRINSLESLPASVGPIRQGAQHLGSELARRVRG